MRDRSRDGFRNKLEFGIATHFAPCGGWLGDSAGRNGS